MSGPHTEAADVANTLPADGAIEDDLRELTLKIGLHRQQLGTEHLRAHDDPVGSVEPGCHRLVDDRIGVGRLLRDAVGGADEESSVLGRHRRTLPTVWDEPRVSGDFPL